MLRSVLTRLGRLGLQQRIMLYVSGGLVVVLAAYGVVSLQAIGQSTDLVFHERLAVARAVAQEIDRDLSHLQNELSEASGSIGPMLATGRPTDAGPILDAVYEHWSSYDGFTNPCVISLTDASGKSLWVAPQLAGCPASPGSLPVLQAALRSGQASIVDEVSAAADGHGSLWLTTPVSVSNRTVGFIIANINLSRISQRFAPMLALRKSDYDIELIDRAGVTIASTQATQVWSVSPHFQLVSDLVMQSQPGVMPDARAADPGQPSDVIAFAPLSTASWGIIVNQPRDTALELPRALQDRLVTFGVAILALGLALAWITTRAVVRPVNGLIDATQRIAAGQLDHPLDIAGEGEVGRLARSFDEMRADLKQSREEIARWNRELEDRVEQRTRELATLYEALQEKEAARAVLLEKVITAQEEERQRVAREIHDELGQILTRLSINLKMCEADLAPQSDRAAQSFAAMQTLVWQTIEHAHRLVVELRPMLLDELGLEAALREELNQRLAPLGVETALTTQGALERLPASVEIAVFRIAQEAISNIARHAQARSATLSLRYDGEYLEVSVEDDGVGVPGDWQARGDGHRPLGLMGMQERATLLGGTLIIGPRLPSGTRVALRVPLAGHAQVITINSQDIVCDY